jgi:hypothetical protein
MARLMIREQERTVDPGLTTWGDLLGSVDRELSESGEVVTAARFDGREEPDFRHPSVVGVPLSSVGIVEIQSCSPAGLLGQTLAEARSVMPEFRVSCKRLAEEFRGLDLQRANQGLVDFSTAIGALVAIVQTTGAALQVDLEHLLVKGRSAREVLVEFAGFLSGLISAQETQDWLTVADILEYDVEPAVPHLAGILTELSRARAN